MDCVLMTDSSSDLPWDFYRERDVQFLPMTATIDGKMIKDDGTTSAKSFFSALRNGAPATTSQLSIQEFKDAFEKVLNEGKDIFYIGLSAGLSGSNQSALVARNELAGQYPDRRIYVGQSVSVSLGLGLLVYSLAQKRDAGASYDEMIAWFEENQLKAHHLFTVDDLMFLLRGGRVSRTSAVVGSLLGIKPMLHVSDEGKLLPHGKVRGRRQSLTALVDEMEALVTGTELECVTISHGDCPEDAQMVMDLIKSKYKVQHSIIHTLGPVIGSHAGPGTVALFFYGAPRTK